VLIRCLNARRRPFTLKEGAAVQTGRLSPSVVRENGMHRDALRGPRGQPIETELASEEEESGIPEVQRGLGRDAA
jgi:hypothetical protein